MGTPANSPLTTAKLLDRREVAENTMAFRFARPAGWVFKAGQSMDLTLLNPAESDAEGNTRAFSIASAPHEPDLTIATRMRDSAFKRVLKNLPPGTEVRIEGPFGDFRLHNKAARPAVILAGGIGITPFRSMVVEAAHERLPHRIYLFYSNRRPEDAPFLEELDTFQQRNPNYKLIATMTHMRDSRRRWDGETSPINMEMLDRHIPGRAESEPIYYIAGPPRMVQGLYGMLTAGGVDSDDIRTEEFPGY